jgi:hypothetical protein
MNYEEDEDVTMLTVPMKLERAFWAFHAANPHVYVVLCRLAREWIAVHGEGKLGAKMLFERARWDIAMETRDASGFKLNNNHTAFYARLMMKHEPDLADVFNLRRQRVAPSFGPENETLPSGDHIA